MFGSRITINTDHFLGEVTGRDDIAMNYQNYQTVIVARYKVHLVGWPKKVPFTNPSHISTEHLQRLRDALQSHECMWQVMTRQEVDIHNANLETSTSAPRKERSDKNKKRRPARARANENDDDTGDQSEHAPVKKKKRTVAAKDKGKGKRTGQSRKKGGSKAARQMPPLPISAEFVPSDLDSDDE